MSSDTLIVLLPLLALLLAAVSIAALYYWWSSGQEEPTVDQESQTTNEAQPQEYHLDDPTVGDLVGKVTTSAQSWIANIAKVAAPTTSPASMSSYSSTARVTSVSDGEMVEVLRILRDLADGELVVEIGGKRYRDLAEMTDPQIKRRFMGNAQALSRFAGGETSFPDQAIWSSPPSGTVKQPSSLPQPEKPSFSSLVQSTESTPIPNEENKSDAPKTIADEIEEMLQLRLSMTPSLMGRSIHIRPTLEGGIRVEVDGHGFDSVSDVSDLEVLGFIQSVIREWESRT
jgi:hypothetical protein